MIARNMGGGGSKDIHLEDFSVSNGGPNLIEDASLVFAFGRRYGLVRCPLLSHPCSGQG